MQIPLLRLKCGQSSLLPGYLRSWSNDFSSFNTGCNSYEWGKVGDESAAARFASATGFEIQQDKPYAELWMGTHSSLPSHDVETGRSLLDMVQDNNALLSNDVAKRYGSKLPFLFKVLSITKALSIQAHPNKQLAETLHEKDPEHYPDDNHKPEMAIAITPFDGFCGFRPLKETAHFLKSVKPLRDLVGADNADSFVNTVTGHETTTSSTQQKANKEALKSAFAALMSCATDSARLEPATESLVSLANSSGSNFANGGGPGPNDGKELSDLVIRLNSQFPNDIGLFVLFFLNYVKLEPGEAMFLRADDIHAYLSGDIMECMASSDNVVRAGFTPKFKDVDTLTSMLTYSFAPIEEQKMSPQDYMYVKLDRKAYSEGSSSIVYDPPIDEFAVVKTELNGGGKATFEPLDGPSIVICTQGAGKISVGPKTEEVKEGFVFFVGATAECVLEGQASEQFVTFKAFCELNDQPVNGTRTNGSL